MSQRIAYFEDRRWLGEGFQLLRSFAGYKRDYLMPTRWWPLPGGYLHT